jgi:hypothetical protein
VQNSDKQCRYSAKQYRYMLELFVLGRAKVWLGPPLATLGPPPMPQNLFWGAARRIMRPIFLSSNNPPKVDLKIILIGPLPLFLATNEVSLGGEINM